MVAVAPLIATQLAPELSQRCHWRVKVIVAVPTQVPLADVRVCPSLAVPVIAGSTVFTGGPVVITAVAALVALAAPAEFVAVTTTRMVLPTFALATRYVADVAPLIAAHDAPLELHCCHW